MVVCSAIAKSTGARCRRAALKGAAVCFVHGAAAGQVRRAAAVRVAEAQAVAVYQRHAANGDAPGPVDVLAELERLVAEVTRFKDYAAERIEALSAGQWAAHDPATAAEIGLFERACDRAARLLVDVARLNLDERIFRLRARVNEEIASQVAGVFERSLYRMELTQHQWALARQVFPDELGRLVDRPPDA
jgi:hypothetical protein